MRSAFHPDSESPPQAATRAVRASLDADPVHGSVMPPIHLSTTHSFAAFGVKRRYDYCRSGNPTRDALADALAALEDAATATVVASGMAAVHLVGQLVRPGERVVVPHDCYGGTWRLFTHLAARGAFELTMVDQHDAGAVAEALAGGPKLLWIETPSNPLLRIVDIAALAARAHGAGALVCVDNTFLSPALQQPFELGADLVVHSTTKYLNGHSDVVGGAVLARDAALGEELAWWANCLGLTGSPFDAWQCLRGLRTLHVRLAQQQASAAVLAERLAADPAVRAVHWPGLPSHPQHALARRQQRGFGAMVSFELADEDAARAFCEGLACFSLAESLGGVESLIAHPATMTHAAMDPAARYRAGITEGLLRLSVGLEASEDLERDIAAGLARAAAGRPAALSA